MNGQTQKAIQPSYLLPATTRLGHVHLTVADLDRQLGFYQKVLNMQLHWRKGSSAGLGAGEHDLLRLTEVPGARRVHHTTGLYHLALQYPSRKELARAAARLIALGYPNAPTDHVVSESIYVEDPEGQTIELYLLTLQRGTIEVVDGNLSVRRADGKPATGVDPLDVEDLLKEVAPDEQLDRPLPRGTTLGHVNLWTADIDDEMHFFHDVLGFMKGPVSTRMHSAEVGLSQDLPHVIPFNTWQGKNAPPPPPNSIGIRYFTIVVPDRGELERVLARVRHEGIATEETSEGILVRDPAHIGIVLNAASDSRG